MNTPTDRQSETETLVLVEFWQGRPSHVITRAGRGFRYYDVDWCQRDEELYYHLSGFGPSNPVDLYMEYPQTGVYWLAAGYEMPTLPTATRLPDLPTNYAADRLFRSTALESETVGCDLCGDRFPDDAPCEHIWWCDRCTWWTQPGERCGHNRNGNSAKVYEARND